LRRSPFALARGDDGKQGMLDRVHHANVDRGADRTLTSD
jgi:hypothetical protein